MKDGGYRRENAFWKARALADLVAEAPEPERDALSARIDALARPTPIFRLPIRRTKAKPTFR